MKTRALAYIAILPMLVTALVTFFVPPMYENTFVSLTFATLVFTAVCLLPFFAYVTIVDYKEVRIVNKAGDIVTVISGILAFNFLAYLLGNSMGLSISLVGSTGLYFAYFYYNTKRSGGIAYFTLRNSRKVLLTLSLYLGIVPWTFTFIRGLTTISIPYALFLAFAFATLISSTNAVFDKRPASLHPT